MTLEQLRIFIAVAEREHVTQAARAINLTQSATSAAIAALEERHATKLFNRIGRRIELTDAGRTFLTEARAVLARAGAAELVLADFADLKRGSLALAASQTIANYWLPRLMHRFRTLFPGIGLTLTISNSEQVARAVGARDVDVGFVEGEIEDPALSVDPVAEDELVLVVGRDHPWAAHRKVKAADLVATRWVVREPGSGTRAMFEDALRDFGLVAGDLDVALELPSNEAVRTAVEAGGGAAVLSRHVVAPAIEAGTLLRLDLALPKRRFLAVRHKERYITRAEREFLALAAPQLPRAGRRAKPVQR